MRRPNWSPAEDAILRRHYAAHGGPVSCLRELPMRTYDGIVQRASMLKLTVTRPRVAKAKVEPVAPKNLAPRTYRQEIARGILAEHERDRTAVAGPRLPGRGRPAG